MTHAVDAASIVQTVSAFLYIGLGVWVLTLTPRRLQTKLLGAFAVSFGLTFALFDLVQIFHPFGWSVGLQFLIFWLPFGVLAHVAALGLAWAVPDRLRDRRLLLGAVAIGALLGLVGVLAEPDLFGGEVPFPALVYTGWFVASAGAVAATILLALRARPARDPTPDDVTQLAILTVALAMLDGFVAGMEIPQAARPTGAGLGRLVSNTFGPAAITLMWVGVAGFWAWQMGRADDDTVPIYRAAMLAILGLIVGGALYKAAFPAVSPGGNVMRGVMRTLGVGLLAYGVLRHDLAGLDAKVEWTISKTTVAGVFVAVFFIVSEGAQVLFAGVVGSQLLGIIAAGALLFALAPIQKAADRIAAKAVPGGAEAGQDAEERYKAFVDMALADGEISREEARRLAERADELGLTNARARTLREQVEDEARGGDAP